MKKAEQATRVRAIAAYLDGIGHQVSNVQCYEILARALGLKNKHVLAQLDKNEPLAAGFPLQVSIEGEPVPVRSLTAKPFTIEEMTAMDWKFDFVIPLALDDLEDIDKQNDAASTSLTGNEYALEDLRYEHVPEIQYGKGYVAYRVQAYVSNPEDIFEEVRAAAEALFYADLQELAGLIKDGANVCFSTVGVNQSRIIRNVNRELVGLLQSYAATDGDTNDAINARSEEIACELQSLEGATPEAERYLVRIPLSSLKYASKESGHTWHVSVNNLSAHLVFNA